MEFLGEDVLRYLYGLLDPHDIDNPKYAEIRRQIDAVESARATIAACRLPTYSVEVKDTRLLEVSKATIEAKLFGCGLLMIMPDNSFRHLPLDAVKIDTSKLED